MKLAFTLLGIFISSKLYCQQDSFLRNNPHFWIGKAIYVNDSFSIDKYSYVSQHYKTYKYLPAQKDSIQVGGVNFGRVSITLDRKSRIRRISFFKSYVSQDSLYLTAIFDKDCSDIIEFISQVLNIQPKLYNPHCDAHYYRTGIMWKSKKEQYTLLELIKNIRHQLIQFSIR